MGFLDAIDETKPDGTTEKVKVLDDYQRELRLAVKTTMAVCFNLDDGTMKEGQVNVAFVGAKAGFPAAGVAGALAIATDQGNAIYYDTGAAWVLLNSIYVCVRDKKAAGNHGGSSIATSWTARVINEELSDTGGICSIGSNQITLAAGTYRCLISSPFIYGGIVKIRLYNTTGAAVLLYGTPECCFPGTWPTEVSVRSVIAGSFTLAVQSVLEVQYYTSLAYASIGLGSGTSVGDEIYTIAEFWKVA